MLSKKLIPIGLAISTLFFSFAAYANTLDDVKSRKTLICGTSTSFPGFSYTDGKGERQGFDVDFCRAIASAIFSDPKKVRFKPLTAKTRLSAVTSGEVDVLIRNTTWTFTRDVGLHLTFAGINYYDGQGFMVHASAGVKTLKDLDGATICVNTGTTTEINLAERFNQEKISYEPILADTEEQGQKLYESGRCDAFTGDGSWLATSLSSMPDPLKNIILPYIISKEPLGPVVRQGDDSWADLVRWTLFAMISAEEHGITSKNVDTMKKTSKDPEVLRLLGVEGNFGKKLGVPNDWAYNIIKQVGNYGEVFERNLGKASGLNIPRGLNKLWTKGGLMYSPPFR